eukprot:4664916-Pyramimonas_sp.AAC.1
MPVICVLNALECVLHALECVLNALECVLSALECVLNALDCVLNALECVLSALECVFNALECVTYLAHPGLHLVALVLAPSDVGCGSARAAFWPLRMGGNLGKRHGNLAYSHECRAPSDGSLGPLGATEVPSRTGYGTQVAAPRRGTRRWSNLLGWVGVPEFLAPSRWAG